MNDGKLETYKGFEIVPFSEGFKIGGGNLIAIASYIVRNDKVVSGFAFAIGFLDRVAQPNFRDDDLLQQAVKIIKKYIDNNLVKNLEEYTYGFYSSNFLEENNPKWWTKTLKKYYGEK